MIISDKFVFITTPKTASTVTRNFLNGKFRCKAQSKYMIDLSEKNRNKFKFGIVRNPWEYYVSWYTYQASQSNSLWMECILNGKKKTFENFLTQVMSYRGNEKGKKNKWELEKFALMNGFSGDNLDIGLYTWYYIAYFSNLSKELLMNGEQTVDDILSNYGQFIHMDYLCDMRSLNIEIPKALAKAGHKGVQFGSRKENTTKHKHYSEYYNDVTKALVGEKDKLIIETHGFKFKQ